LVVVVLFAAGMPAAPIAGATTPALPGSPVQSVVGNAAALPVLASPRPKPPVLETPKGHYADSPTSGSSPAGPAAGSSRPGVRPSATLAAVNGATELWDNGDGTTTAVARAQRSAWKDSAGHLHEFDDHLVAAPGGYTNASGPVGIHLADNTAAGEVVQASGTGGWSLGFSLAGASPSSAGAVSGAAIRYLNAQPAVDLVESVQGDNVKETIVLTDAAAAAASGGHFRFPLTLTGLIPKAEADGSIGFFDTTGAQVATMPPGQAYDASGDPAHGTAATTPVAVKLVQTGSQ
jgi:hypothetical protein